MTLYKISFGTLAILIYNCTLLACVASACKQSQDGCEKEKVEICEMRLTALRTALINYDADKRLDLPSQSPDIVYFVSDFAELDAYFSRGAPRHCPCGGDYILDPKSKEILCPHGHQFKESRGKP